MASVQPIPKALTPGPACDAGLWQQVEEALGAVGDGTSATVRELNECAGVLRSAALELDRRAYQLEELALAKAYAALQPAQPEGEGC
jgi:hypothetical protein